MSVTEVFSGKVYQFYQWTINVMFLFKKFFVDGGDIQLVTNRFDRNTYCSVSEGILSIVLVF